MKELFCPIYRFEAHWLELGSPSQFQEVNGLPQGYIRNFTSFYDMFKAPKSQNELDTYMAYWWKNYTTHRRIRRTVHLLKLNHSFLHTETWCLAWFQHWTFDVGQTNDECLQSFSEYIERIKRRNIENGHKETEPNHEGSYKSFTTLMGAEDRWRWRGMEPTGDSKSESKPPCRCKFCKERGVLRIGH